MEQIFRKVMVSERLPGDGEKHIFHLKKSIPSMDEGEKNYDECYTIHKEQIREVKKHCDWWMEEVKLFPTIEEINKKLFYPNDKIKDKAAMVGAKWVHYKTLGKIDI